LNLTILAIVQATTDLEQSKQLKSTLKEPMQNTPTNDSQAVSRRQFIRTSSLAAASAAAAASFPAVLRAATKQPINAVIIGIGGRGGGAGGNFLEAAKNVGVEAKIVAVADLFPEQARRGKEHFNVPEELCFSGFDGYMKALAVPGVNYAILASPPGFRAAHFKACVEAGKNVFMEKPVAVDGPTCRIMYAAADLSKQKNLKVAAGTQRRHQAGYIETIKRINDGAIGDVVTLRAYWVNGGPIWHRGEQGTTELERQIRNWYHYIWLSGDHICEQHVHNLDVCNWIMGTHPVRCWAQGSRQQLGDKSGEIWDNFDIEYEYPNGVHMFAYCGQIKRDWSRVDEAVHGSKGSSAPGGMIQPKDGQMWRFREKAIDPYVQEHMDLINAIQNDTPLNEAHQVTDSTLTAIMGREAGYSGAGVNWEDMLNSKFSYGPELLYTDCAKMQYGPSRVLQPPMPSLHNILKDPPVVAVKG
jgi:predicted dehydrogenase